MKEKLTLQASVTAKMDFTSTVLLYRLKSESDQLEVTELLENHQPRVRDELNSQLHELIKLRYPKQKLSNQKTKLLINQLLNSTPLHQYGVWAYYPWSNSLVHILDEAEFIEVKTNRNKHKITEAESKILSKQIVGVVGLSVGRTISATMTMERSYGEIRLADYDILELSNYNRIRSGLFDLGLNKTVSLAREIAEIDPYLKVTCFHDGLTEGNMDEFFTKNGKINVLIDECDGLDIKILLREKAKKLQIPVIMDMNDRGTMDIERFDLEPDRPLLHGLIGHLDSTKLKGLTNEEKIPYIMPMLGESTISTKLKASMLEIEQTITTWPQLASDVTLGGAVTANIYRRIILGEFTDSGRYFVDIDDIIRNKESTPFKIYEPTIYERKDDLNDSNILQYIENLDFAIQKNQLDISKAQIEIILKAATLASSTANAQPWKWCYYKQSLILLHDASVANSFGDFENLGSNISYGAALENLVQKSQKIGLFPLIESTPHKKKGSHVVAVIKFFALNNCVEELIQDNLAEFIELRCTNRRDGHYSLLEDEDLNQLVSSANSVAGVKLKLFTDPVIIRATGKLIGESDKFRFLNESGHKDFFIHEVRWTKEESEKTRDGIDLRTTELSEAAIAGLRMASDFDVIEHLKVWDGGGVFTKAATQAFEQTSAIGLFCVDKCSPENALLTGRSLARTWLKATKLNIAVQPWMSMNFNFNRLISGSGIGMDEDFADSMKKIRALYEELLGFDSQFKELFLVRFFKGNAPSIKSMRKPIKEIFFDLRSHRREL